MTTREAIYLITSVAEFLLIIVGVDEYFGEEVRKFCMILFPIWFVGKGIRNWKQIVEFFTEGLFNLKEKMNKK